MARLIYTIYTIQGGPKLRLQALRYCSFIQNMKNTSNKHRNQLFMKFLVTKTKISRNQLKLLDVSLYIYIYADLYGCKFYRYWLDMKRFITKLMMCGRTLKRVSWKSQLTKNCDNSYFVNNQFAPKTLNFLYKHIVKTFFSIQIY